MPSDLGSHLRTALSWTDAARIQPWRFAEAEIWDELAGEDDLPGVLAILRMTEPDVYGLLGVLERLEGVPWMRGEGAGWVMPAFTWGGPGRFSDGSFGCFYVARELETAVAETVHHQERFLRATAQAEVEVRMRVLRADVRADDVVALAAEPRPPALNDSEDHEASRAFGASVRAAGIQGISYHSRRREGGRCAALYNPECVLRCVSAEALAYLWDGVRVRVEIRSPLDWESPA